MEHITSIAQHLLQFSPDARLTTAPAPAQRSRGRSHAWGRCRLVLLEDNDSVRAATELFLTLEGYETRSAGSISEVEPLLADLQSGDMLISDYHLDDSLTGLDVLHGLRGRLHRDVPAILLSGDRESMMRVVKTAVPNCRFLSKPVDTSALLDAIAELSNT
jgi:two-component system CheB/CheR fusion protein